MLERETHGTTRVLRMQHGKANALDVALLTALRAALDEAEADGSRAVVLTGHGAIFCAGVDLRQVVAGGAPYVGRYLPAMSGLLLRLFNFPRPVVAAINGHAIAAGCILSCACDHRVVADGPARFGIPELLVGLPFPLVALEVCRAVVPAHELQALIYSSRTYGVGDALAHHLVDEVAPAAALLPRALEIAARLGAVPSATFARTKHALRAPTLARIEAERHAADIETAAVWTDPATLAAVADYVARTLDRPRS